jgi:hypothetical protein
VPGQPAVPHQEFQWQGCSMKWGGGMQWAPLDLPTALAIYTLTLALPVEERGHAGRAVVRQRVSAVLPRLCLGQEHPERGIHGAHPNSPVSSPSTQGREGDRPNALTLWVTDFHHEPGSWSDVRCSNSPNAGKSVFLFPRRT